jgi:hypothetical protein
MHAALILAFARVIAAHGTLGHQEGAGDLGHGQTADHAQRQRHAGFHCQRRVAAGEDQPQAVTVDGAGRIGRVVVVRHLRVLAHRSQASIWATSHSSGRSSPSWGRTTCPAKHHAARDEGIQQGRISHRVPVKDDRQGICAYRDAVDLRGPALARVAKDFGYTLDELRKLWGGERVAVTLRAEFHVDDDAKELALPGPGPPHQRRWHGEPGGRRV